MVFLIDTILGLAALAALALGVLVLVQSLVAVVMPANDDKDLDEGEVPSFVVLVPAHDEAAGIEPVVQGLIEQVEAAGEAKGRLVVIADNCTDDTAALARGAGAEVLERNDPEHRGKGYAIAFGLEALAESPPDVVVLVDADCHFEIPTGIRRLVAAAGRKQSPIQAQYVLTPPEDPSPKTRISAFAVVFKNVVRTRGMALLNLPVPLLGSGMAFPYALLRQAPATEGYLVEDMLIGLELAKLGKPPVFLESVRVTSPLPTGEEAANRQRRRWEHGHLETIQKNGIPTFVQGVKTQSVPVSLMALDLMIPPLALFIVLLVGLMLVTLVWSLFGSGYPLRLAFYALMAVGFGATAGWLKFGLDVLPPSDIGHVARYIAWKLPLYKTFFAQGSHQSWERTTRDGDPPESPK